VSINLLTALRRFYIVIDQHQALPLLEFFQSSSCGQNNIITSQKVRIVTKPYKSMSMSVVVA